MCKKNPSRIAKREFNIIFGEDVRHGRCCGVECDRCGSSVAGDGDPIKVVCAECIDTMRNGAHTATTPCCFTCLMQDAEEDPGILFDPETKPITRKSGAYPDGFTCVDCGDSFAWRGDRMTKIGENR